MKSESKYRKTQVKKKEFNVFPTKNLNDAIKITPLTYKSSSQAYFPLISDRNPKRISENFYKIRNSSQKILPKKLSHQNILGMNEPESINSNDLQMPLIKNLFPKPRLASVQTIDKKASFSEDSKSTSKQFITSEIMIKNPTQTKSSCESLEIDDNMHDTFNSITSIQSKKFNSAPIRKQTTKKSTVGSILSEYSLKNGKFGSLNREPTIENILDEMNSTPNVAVYNDLKFKLVTKDPILENINGVTIKWKFVDLIGNGSFGQVLKALNIESGKIFAVKRLYYNPSSPPQLQFISAQEQEMKILQGLKHSHIVKYLGNEKIDDNYCIYVEYLSGGSLSKLIYKVGPLPETAVKNYTKQILKGLLYLHSNNIIHRDLKSDNILLDSNGKLKLCDFGCSKRYENDLNESGLVVSMKGSLPWMAPEVMKQGGYGRKADIWSLGCVVIEMLSGKPPWGGVENQILLMMKVIVYNDMPEIPQGISAQGKDFILQCLLRDSNKRPSAEELFQHPFITSINSF
jgi:Protein kinase domain